MCFDPCDLRADTLDRHFWGYPSSEEIDEIKVFRYGYFAAIIIESSNVVLDFKGHRLKQSEDYRFKQRFFSLIELANSPFIPNQGLPREDSPFISANNVIIQNGTLGASSHHGIHGNNNSNIMIMNMKIKDFEVGGISLNNVKNLKIVKCKIGPNSDKVYVNAKFSAAQQLFNQTLFLKGKQVPLSLLYTKDMMVKILRSIHEKKIKDIDTLFKNPKKTIDGNSYGILIHKKGIAIGAHGEDTEYDKLSKNIFMKDVKIYSIKSDVDEKIGLKFEDKVMRDIAGQHIDLVEVVNNGIVDYLTKAQIETSSLFEDMKSTLHVDEKCLKWYREGADVKKITSIFKDRDVKLVRGGDSMMHVNKGSFGLRIDGCANVRTKNIKICHIINEGDCIPEVEVKRLEEIFKVETDMLDANLEGTTKYTGCNSFGIIISNSNCVRICCSVGSIKSTYGYSRGIVIQNGSKNVKVKSTIKNSNIGVMIGSSCKQITKKINYN